MWHIFGGSGRPRCLTVALDHACSVRSITQQGPEFPRVRAAGRTVLLPIHSFIKHSLTLSSTCSYTQSIACTKYVTEQK